MHCAARVSVPESVADPLGYYRANVSGMISTLESLEHHGCYRVVFSSSASIYAPGDDFTVDESSTVAPTSPYARTKAVGEQILGDVAASGAMRSVSLRYFNPIGADPYLRTGLAADTPSHALGRLITAHRRGEPFTIFGVDWPTRDGTTIRDYIHVWDLARAHVATIGAFDTLVDSAAPATAINIGTGQGTTVRELATTFNAVVPHPVEVLVSDRRPGDSVGAYTRSDRAQKALRWKPEFELADGIEHALTWADRWYGGTR